MSDECCPRCCGETLGCVACTAEEAVTELADAAHKLLKHCEFSEDPPGGMQDVRDALRELEVKGWWEP